MEAYIISTILCPECETGLFHDRRNKKDHKLWCINQKCPLYHIIYHAPKITLQKIEEKSNDPKLTSTNVISNTTSFTPPFISHREDS